MSTADSTPRGRQRRQKLPIAISRLGQEPEACFLPDSTPEERFLAVAELSKAAWRLAGRKIPRLPRHRLPGTIHRPESHRE